MDQFTPEELRCLYAVMRNSDRRTPDKFFDALLAKLKDIVDYEVRDDPVAQQANTKQILLKLRSTEDAKAYIANALADQPDLIAITFPTYEPEPGIYWHSSGIYRIED